jgi:hypothetical protein
MSKSRWSCMHNHNKALSGDFDVVLVLTRKRISLSTDMYMFLQCNDVTHLDSWTCPSCTSSLAYGRWQLPRWSGSYWTDKIAFSGSYLLSEMSFWTKLGFVLGGLSLCFNCSIPRARFASYHHIRETLKRVCLYTLLSLHLSLSLSSLGVLQSSELYTFRWRCSRRSRFVRST